MIENPTTLESAVRLYSPMVRGISMDLMRRLPSSVDPDDLFQCGMEGLMQAFHAFDAGREIRFSTFASTRVRGAMLDGLRESDFVPRSTRTNARRIAAARTLCEQQTLGNASAKDVARQLGVSVTEYHHMMVDIYGGALLYFEDFGRSEGCKADDADFYERHLASPNDTPSEIFTLGSRRSDLDAALNTMTDREQHLLVLYYGEDMTFAEASVVLGVTESRCCQMHSAIIKKLRAGVGHWHRKDLNGQRATDAPKRTAMRKKTAATTSRNVSKERWEAVRAQIIDGDRQVHANQAAERFSWTGRATEEV